MLRLPWPYLTMLTAGYVLALTYGQLSLQASIPITLLLLAGFAVQPQNHRYARYLGHSLFVLVAIALALHSLPGFHNAQVIKPQRFSENAVPFSMYLNLDKSLLGFWLLLACPWLIAQRAFSPTLKTSASAIALTLTALVPGHSGRTQRRPLFGQRLRRYFGLVPPVLQRRMIRWLGDGHQRHERGVR